MDRPGFKNGIEKSSSAGRTVGINAQLVGLLVFIAFAFMTACADGEGAQSQGSSINGTGIPVGKEFLSFYEQNGSARVIGYPLLVPYIDTNSGRQIQYFKRMRLEYDQDNGNLSITQLGKWAIPNVENQVPASVASSEASRSFPDTGLKVQDEFLAFFEANGGEMMFGLPLSPQLDEGGTRVQYFENARLEWHPEATIDNRIQVGLLGETHFRQVGIHEGIIPATPESSPMVSEAKVRAYLRAPILYQGEEQIIFVNVKDANNHRPASDKLVELLVTYDGKTETITLLPTDEWGDSQGIIPMSDASAGQTVKIIVTVSERGDRKIGDTSLSFKTWW
jgi:hypothetical protein